LSSNFPTVQSYLGEERFKTLSHSYVKQYWPNDTRLSTYGDRFAEFIGDDFLPFSQDFAKLDRAWLDALFAYDNQPLKRKDIEQIIGQENQQELFSLQLADSVYLVEVNTDSLNEWLELKFDAGTSKNQADDGTVLIWRYEQEVQYRVLSQFEKDFLGAMNESGSVLQSAEKAIANNPNQDIGALFGALLTAGILIKKTK